LFSERFPDGAETIRERRGKARRRGIIRLQDFEESVFLPKFVSFNFSGNEFT
jgi:hypothetical protein